MEFFIALFGIIWIIYKLADDRWTAKIDKSIEEKRKETDKERKEKWNNLVVSYEIEDQIRKKVMANDPEIKQEVDEARKFYGGFPKYVGGYEYLMCIEDALLANRGVIRWEAANNGINILVGGRNLYYQLVNFYLKLNEVLKDHGIDDELYCDMGKLDPFEKAEDLLTRDPKEALGLKLRWRSSLSEGERYCSDLRRGINGEREECFNDTVYGKLL